MTKIIVESTDQSKDIITIELSKAMQQYFDEYRNGERKEFECRVMTGTGIYKIRFSDF